MNGLNLIASSVDSHSWARFDAAAAEEREEEEEEKKKPLVLGISQS